MEPGGVRFVEINGKPVALVVLAGCHGHVNGFVGGGGQHKAVVVVGVFANQIDAARRADNERRLPETVFKKLAEVGSHVHGIGSELHKIRCGLRRVAGTGKKIVSGTNAKPAPAAGKRKRMRVWAVSQQISPFAAVNIMPVLLRLIFNSF